MLLIAGWPISLLGSAHAVTSSVNLLEDHSVHYRRTATTQGAAACRARDWL
jgi:hypothetical protein